MEKNLILTRAQAAEMSHDFSTAARMYKQLLDDDPSNVDYLKSVAGIYVQAGEDEKAIPYYEQIIAYYPHYVEAMNSLGAIYRRLKRYEESINILQRALDEGRQLSSINYNLGFTYKEMGNFDDAIEAFEIVIAANPNDVLAHNHLGSIYLALKDYQKSVAAFKRGLQIDQNHPILNYNLARCYEAAKNYPDAIRCYSLALKTRPGWEDAIRDFSSLLIKCQKNKEAQDLVQQSIKLHPDDANMLYLLGRIYQNQFDYDNAQRTLKKAKALQEDDVKILTALSKAYEKDDKNEQALEVILDAMDINPNDKDVRKQYASTLMSSNNYAEAGDIVEGLYSEEGGDKDCEILDLLGQYCICKDDEAKAKEYYSKIQRVNHHYKDHMISAAARSAQNGKIDQAELYANQYVERRPQNPDGYMALGKIYEQKGDFIGARNFFSKSATLRIPNVYAAKKIALLKDKLEDLTLTDSLQEITDEEMKVEGLEVVSDENENAENEVAENFDMNQMGDDVPAEEEESKEEYFEKLADNLDANLADEIDEEEDFFEIQDPDEMNLIDEDDTAFSFEQEDEAANPLKEDTSGDFFGRDEASLPKNILPEMEKIQDETKESADVAKEAVMNAQKLVDDLAAQRDMMAQQLAAQQQMLQEQFAAQQEQMKQNAQNMVKEAVSDFLEYDPDEKQEVLPEEKPIQKAVPASEPVPEPEPEPEPVEEPPAEDDFDFESFDTTTATEDIPEEAEEEEGLEIEEPSLPDVEISVNEPSFDEQFEKEIADDVGEDFSTENASEEVEPEEDLSEESVPEEVVSEEIAPEDNATEDIESEEVSDESENAEIVGDEVEIPDEESAEETEEAVVEEPSEEVSDGEEIAEEESEIDNMEGDYQFVTTEDLLSDEKSDGEEIPEDDFELDLNDSDEEENSVLAEEALLDGFAEETEPAPEGISVEDMLERIQRILNDDKIAEENAEKLELFRTLRILTNFLPETEKNTFQSCRMRMMIEYIIAKLSGKPGLLLTAQSLIKSGVLGEDYENQLSKDCEYDMGNELIRKVIKDMKKLAENLDDSALAQSLCITADGILEQIELRNQKSEIF